eukprot:PRCOL_00005503-RA
MPLASGARPPSAAQQRRYAQERLGMAAPTGGATPREKGGATPRTTTGGRGTRTESLARPRTAPPGGRGAAAGAAAGATPARAAPTAPVTGGASAARATTANLTVAVRVRPLSDKESAASSASCLETLPRDEAVGKELRMCESVGARDYLRVGRGRVRQYAFDVVLAPSATQQETYESTAAKLVPAVLEGENASIFAYGATGAGKTHTDPGIMVLALEELFARLERAEDSEAEVHISMLEIYCENVKDLLAPDAGTSTAAPLHVRENSRGSTTVAGLTRHLARDAAQVMEMLHRGNARRACEPTRANETSSRSHAILQVEVRRGGASRAGKLSLVDLAGSERALATDARTARSVEGANINKSLLALSSCITALVTGKRHVPFRNSNLTKLLRDSLGGNCRTAMIANVSPALGSFSESSNTLHWADKAKLIKCELKPEPPTPAPIALAPDAASIAAPGGSSASRGEIDESSLPPSVRVRLRELTEVAERKTAEAAALRARLERHGIAPELTPTPKRVRGDSALAKRKANLEATETAAAAEDMCIDQAEAQPAQGTPRTKRRQTKHQQRPQHSRRQSLIRAPKAGVGLGLLVADAPGESPRTLRV